MKYAKNAILVMVDLETTRANVNADIISLGATVYIPNTTEYAHYERFARYDELTFDTSTLRFWANKNETFVELLQRSDESMFNEKEMLIEFNAFLKAIGNGHACYELLLFGNGATFDNALLRKKMAEYGIPYAIKYKNDLDYRTVEFVHATLGIEREHSKRENEHDALSDAQYQMNELLNMLFDIWEVAE